MGCKMCLKCWFDFYTISFLLGKFTQFELFVIIVCRNFLIKFMPLHLCLPWRCRWWAWLVTFVQSDSLFPPFVLQLWNPCLAMTLIKIIMYVNNTRHKIVQNLLQHFLKDMTSEIMRNALSSASIKSLFHMLQCWRDEKIQHYNHLPKCDPGQSPQPYNLSAVTTRVTLFCGKEDNLVSCRDVLRLCSTLPNCVEFKEVSWKKFNHIDFVYAKDINPLLNDRIL